MSLSKQLYLIISFIFLMIFVGNFILSIQNTKEYLEIESTTKAQDTATSLGMLLKTIIKNKKDPEIETTIKAIANRGFYKELRLEDLELTFTQKELLSNSTLDNEKIWTVSNVITETKYGIIETINNDDDLMSELDSLEGSDSKLDEIEAGQELTFRFIPSKEYKEGGLVTINFSAKSQDQELSTSTNLMLSKELVKVTRDIKFDYIPQWFINSFALTMKEQQSEISDGWKTSAIIYVSANPGDAYAKLYEQAKQAIVTAIIFFVISILLLVVFLQFILKPLKNIETLAINIAQGKFSTIDKLPWTTEIKNVATAMNEMSRKIEGIITKLNSNVENMTKKISLDDLTGLNLRQTFETDMKKMFISKTDGYVLSIKIDNLGSFAKNNSPSQVDKLIRDFALLLKDSNNSVDYEVSAYRFFGSEFAIIAKCGSASKIKEFAIALKNGFEKLGLVYEKQNIAYIGATPFNQIGTTPEMMTAAAESCETAHLIGPNEFVIRDENDLARDILSWKELIFDIIDNSKFEVGYISDAYLLNSKKNKLVMQEAFTNAKDKNNQQIPIGTFVSIAEKYNRVIDFDKAVIQKVISHIKEKNIKHDISINLSLNSIDDKRFIAWLTTVLASNETIVSQLVFSITAYGVAKDIEAFKIFAQNTHKNGGKIIIKRFESKFIPLNKIKDLHIDYIRLARDYTSGINKDSGKNAFVESMQELSNLLNIKVYAENVKDDEDLKVLNKLNLYAASR